MERPDLPLKPRDTKSKNNTDILGDQSVFTLTAAQRWLLRH